MKKIITLLFLIIFSSLAFSQNPSWLWARSAGGTYIDNPLSVTTDASGNVYVVGFFYRTMIFFGSDTLVNNDNSYKDIFIVKYNSSGTALWARRNGGNRHDEGRSVTTDASGNVYIAGSFESDSIQFGSTTLYNSVANHGKEVFLAKYDPNGNLLWAKKGSGTYDDVANAVKFDGIGSIYLAGTCFGSITFGATVVSNSTMFLVKYDLSGNIIWARGGYASPNSITTDASGNIYLTGSFMDATVTFGTTTLVNHGSTDILIVKYNSSGNALWATNAGGTSDEVATSIKLDQQGNIFICGYFNSYPISFDSTIAINSSGFSDLYLAKYNATGNVQWVKSASGANNDYAYDIAIDNNGSINLVGSYFSNPFSIESVSWNNGTSPSGYLFKFNTNGGLIYAEPTADEGESFSVAVNNSGGYVVGWFHSIASFGSSSLFADQFTSDIFIAKFSNVVGIDDGPYSVTGFHIFPNPAFNELRISNSELKITEIEIYNLFGEKVFEKRLTSEVECPAISVADFPSGIYFVKVKTEKGIRTAKFIKE